MKYACPKCGTILLEPVRLNREHWAFNKEYPNVRLVNEEEGSFLLCRNKDCSERFPVFSSEKGDLSGFELDKTKLKVVEEE